jgi:hypothetical protein
MPKKVSSHSVSLLNSKSIFFRVSVKMMVDLLRPAPAVDEGLSEQGALDVGLDDQRVRPRIWDVDPVIGSGEGDGLL